MAFTIKCDSGDGARAAQAAIGRALAVSRFTVGSADVYGSAVEIRTVRLRESKDYCGNHPGPCRAGGNRPHKHFKFLEGADWVAFNDLLNDALDSIGHAMTAGSSSVRIRHNGMRRVNYGCKYGPGNHVDWDKNGSNTDYLDCRNLAVGVSDYPNGTPGIDTYARQGA